MPLLAFDLQVSFDFRSSHFHEKKNNHFLKILIFIFTDKSVLYVTQPEGSYHKIIFEEKTALKDAIETLNTLEGIMTVPDVSPEIITKIRSKNGIDKGVAFASAEGILSFIYDDQIVWSKRFEHTLTSLMKLDINQDGEDEIIVSSWDGAVSFNYFLMV